TRTALTGSVPDADTSALEATIAEVEAAYTEREMGESLTRALANVKSYINSDDNPGQAEADSLASKLNEAWEADHVAQQKSEEQGHSEEQEASEAAERKAEKERIAAEKQAEEEAKAREQAEREAARQELQNTIMKIAAGLAVIIIIIGGIIIYRRKNKK